MTTIGLLYDMHINSGRASYGNMHARADTAIDAINTAGPDWTVAGGDIRVLDTGDSWDTWPDDDPYFASDWDTAKDKLDNRLTGDVRVIRGNHDRPVHLIRDKLPPEKYSPSDDRGRQSGGYWGTEVNNGIRYVYLDSVATMGSHGLNQQENYVNSPQISMLKRLIKDDPNIPTFVFIHNPLRKITDTTYNWSTLKASEYELIKNRYHIFNLLQQMNTVLVHCGHVFSSLTSATETFNGIEYSIFDHLGGSGPGDTGWLEIDESSSSADLVRYDIENATSSTLTTVTW